MRGASRQAPWIAAALFLVACEPSATQSSAAVPTGGGAEGAETETPPVPPKKPGESSAKAGEKTLFIRERLVDCEGEGPMTCMQVRASESAEWELFYGRIEGFTYEEGYAYELRVKVEQVKGPMADAPSERLRLVEVVSKEKKEGAGKGSP